MHGSYLFGTSQQRFRDLIPSIPDEIGHFSCCCGDDITEALKKMPVLESLDLWASQPAIGPPTTLDILRATPSLTSFRLILDSNIDFTPADLIKYFSEATNLKIFTMLVCDHLLETHALKSWETQDMEEVEATARREGIKLEITS